jgi:hypothetical protein
MKICVLVLLFVCLYKFGNAQNDTGKSVAPADTLKYLKGKVFYQDKLINKEDLSYLLMRYKYSGNKYSGSISERKNAGILVIIGTVGTLSGLYQVAFNKSNHAFPTFAVALFSFGCSIPLFHLSNIHFRKSISLYNKSVINRINLGIQ